ncbi:unnamed protein product [Paramecium primaurelia]|uniref:Uncharacterized protein n=1 Tax=Paramecium primaurelia TaxID=5886 RepID=A0A8S1NIV7_PARPR|nr:unnamed protein product [Paramecium primaurelia]
MNQQPFTIQNSIQYLQQYQGLLNYTQIKLTDENNNRYKYPVITLNCDHTRFALNLETVLQSINQQGYFTCLCKNITINHPRQLQKDIRWNSNEEINEIFEFGVVIHNYLFHQFLRAKKFNQVLQQNFVLQQIKILMDSQNSINISQILQSISKNNQNQIIFKVICLLDFVQINFPVRFIQCQHPECYDLASILIYQQENSNNNSQIDQLKQFKCKQRQCKVKVDISTQEKIFQNIYLDKELLKLIKKELPTIYKYIYNPITLKIQQDCFIQDDVIIDPQIYQIYKQEFKQQFSALDKDYQDYQKQVIKITQTVLQRTPDVKIEQNLRLHRYKLFQVEEMDQNIEQPARCVNCPISNVMNLKSIISNFYSQKRKYKQDIRYIECVLCETLYSFNVNISKIVYFDTNLFDAQEQGLLENVDKKKKRYNGKKFMKEEFMSKQKLDLSDFKQYLQQKLQCQQFTFFNLYCNYNSRNLIKLPLILKNCPDQRIIEFESFYNRIEQIQINDYEQKCLQFCNCQYCSNNRFSFKEFPFNVYFHEAFYKALIDFDAQNRNQNILTYDFEFNCIIEKQNNLQIQQKSIPIDKQYFKQHGFVPLLGDEQYQDLFQIKNICENIQRQVVKNEIDTVLATLTNTQEGYEGSTKKEMINQKMKNNIIANKWGFEIIKTETQFLNNELKILKGKVSSEQN